MSTSDLKAYRAMLREDFPSFVHRSFRQLNPATRFEHNWHLDVMCSVLIEMMKGKRKRQIINVPPRSLKSHCATIAFPAYVLGHRPSAQITSICYSQDLANKFGLDCLKVMQSDWYRRHFQTRLSPDKRGASEFETTLNGCRYATSVQGTLTGRGGEFCIIDDPMKPEDAASDVIRQSVNDWYQSTFLSRLNSLEDSAILIVMQRLHEDDLVGHLLAKGEKWDVLSLPAIAEKDTTFSYDTSYGRQVFSRKAGDSLHPTRMSLQRLHERREALGPYNWASQYQQQPAPLDGLLVQEGWFLFYEPGQLPRFDMVVQSWDTASTEKDSSSYCVCTTWGVVGSGNTLRVYLLDVLRRRMNCLDLKSAVYAQQNRHRSTFVLVEEKSSGIQLVQELKRERVAGVEPINPTGDKYQRLYNQTPLMASGRFFLPQQAPWLRDYIHELITFPRGRYNDQVDSTSQALEWIAAHSNRKDSFKAYFMEPDSTDELHAAFYNAALRR